MPPLRSCRQDISRNGTLARYTEKPSSRYKAAKGGKRVGDISTAIERIGLAGKYGIVEELAVTA